MVNENNHSDQRECDKIESLGYASLVFSLARSLFLGMGTYLIFSTSKIDTYISVILRYSLRSYFASIIYLY